MGADAEQARCPIMPTYGAPSVMFVRGQGTELWDSQGKRYLDFVGGLAVQSLGHANPEVAEAISEQAMTLTQVSNYWATEHAHHVALQLDRHITGARNIQLCDAIGTPHHTSVTRWARAEGMLCRVFAGESSVCRLKPCHPRHMCVRMVHQTNWLR